MSFVRCRDPCGVSFLSAETKASETKSSKDRGGRKFGSLKEAASGNSGRRARVLGFRV